MLTLSVFVAHTLWANQIDTKELDALHRAEDLITERKVRVNGKVCEDYDRVVEYTDQVSTEVELPFDAPRPEVTAKDRSLQALQAFVLALIEQESEENWGDVPIEEKPLLFEAQKWAKVHALTAACKLLGRKRASFH